MDAKSRSKILYRFFYLWYSFSLYNLCKFSSDLNKAYKQYNQEKPVDMSHLDNDDLKALWKNHMIESSRYALISVCFTCGFSWFLYKQLRGQNAVR